MEKESAPLRFKPMTKGLGFHPFSDGLPYAPVSKSPQISSKRQVETAPTITQPSMPKSMPRSPAPHSSPVSAPPRPIAPQKLDQRIPARPGLGATSAGIPQFSFPPRPAMPAARPAVTRAVSAPAPAELAPTALELDPPGLIYLLKRVTAFMLDATINLTLCGTAFGAALWKLGIPADRLLTPEILIGSSLFFVMFNWALITAQEIAFKTSLGKRAFGLTLEGMRPTAIFLRAFFFVFSAGFLGIGLLWALWDKRRRCWHDLFADAAPREIAEL